MGAAGNGVAAASEAGLGGGDELSGREGAGPYDAAGERCAVSVRRETTRRMEYALGYIALEMFDEAEAELEGIAAEDQLLPPVRSVRVDYHLAQKQWEKTVIVARELARAHPDVENAWVGWAYALRELNCVAEARAVLLEAEAYHGETSAVLHYNLACYDSLLGALESARKRLATACRMDAQFKLAALEDPDLAALRAAERRD